MYKIRRTDQFENIILLNTEIFPLDDLDIDAKTQAWLVTLDSLPAAFCTMRMLEDKIAYMDRGGILDNHRGKGLHKKLIRVRERSARAQGFDVMITYVMEDNYASLFTLVRHGYKMYEPDYAYAGSKGIVYLQKEL